MDEERLVINISPAGNVKIDAQGYSGCGCAEASQELELILGGGAAKKKMKPEFYAPPISSAQGITQTF